jgi:hypothetical protein
MTSSMLMPRRRTKVATAPIGNAEGSVLATRILDWNSPLVATLLSEPSIQAEIGIGRLRATHRLIAASIRPVYAVNDTQPVSRTLAHRRGSCSQRLAVLEAVARSSGIETRVRGILVAGSFWYPRFPHLRWAVPDLVVLAWPEFMIEGAWVSVSELFGSIPELGACSTGFNNAERETLFDAISRTAVDWDGVSSKPGQASTCDLSAIVRDDLGYFSSRDELFDIHGQTLCWLARTVSGPFLSHRNAGTR